MERYKPYEKVTYDSEPFIVPGISDRIELTTSQLPVFGRQSHGENQQTEDTNILPYYRNNHNNHRFFWFWTSKNRTQTKLEPVGLDRFRFGLGPFFKKMVWLFFKGKNRTETKMITPTKDQLNNCHVSLFIDTYDLTVWNFHASQINVHVI